MSGAAISRKLGELRCPELGFMLTKGCCPLDCQDTCSWLVNVEDGNVTGLQGAKDHPITRGVLCAKVRDYEQRLTAPDRLLYPMRRSGAKGAGHFTRISWDEALDEIALRFRAIISEHGAEALWPFYYLGSMGVVQRLALMRVFNMLGSSRKKGNVCAASAIALLGQGYPMAVDPEATVNAQLIILWGQNTLTTSHHQWHFLEEARKRGARIICIDPRSTRTARACDQHLKIIPGTDAILAAALARVMLTGGLADTAYAMQWTTDLEEYKVAVMEWTLPRAAAATGIPEEDIKALAIAYGTARPALIRAGIAPMQTADGESFVLGLSALAILGGHWKLPGGGLSILTFPDLADSKVGRAELSAGEPRSLDMAKLGAILQDERLSPPVKALMIWSANPAVTQIDQASVQRGLAREDLFTVVFDHFITDTARYADIILPATTQFEHFDLQGAWGHFYISVNLPAIAPMGEARSGGEVMRGLARKLGLTHPAFMESDEEIAAAALPADCSIEELKAAAWSKRPLPVGPTKAVALLGNAFKELVAPTAGTLQLLTPKSHYFLNSTFANMPRQRQSQGLPMLDVNPEDARDLVLKDGDTILVRSGNASMKLRLRITDAIRQSCAVLEGKWWGGDGEDSAAMNRLTHSSWSPLGQPAYNDTWITIERAQ